MLTQKELRRLVAYNRAVLEAFLDRFAERSWAFATKDRGIGHGSIRNTVVHLLGVHDGWLNYVLERRYDELDAPERWARPLDSWADIRAFSDTVFDRIETRLAQSTDAEIARPARAPWMPGRYTVGDAYLQTTFEEAHHLGELIGVLWRANIPPPEMTWIPTTQRLAARARRGRR